ncbi:hypothetical protein BJ944DRAFT_245922 [Cunninghamella echinulata]|nr:hypothetical protein BJ944DRAFT_245922 [Cunninghamella echinulata]
MTPLYGFSTDPIIRRKESIMQLSNNVKVEHYTSSEPNFDIEFAKHQHDIKTGNMEKAIQSFVLLQSNSMENTKFQEYLIEISKNIDTSKNAELSGFFASLPCLLQSNIIDFAKDHLAVKNELQAFHILFDYIQEYPRHAYKYMIEAIDMLIHLIETENAEDKNKCFHILVADLLPRLSKQRLLLNYSECTTSVKSTDSKHYIIIPLYLYEKYIMIGQSYFISNRNWDELTKFTCMMISTIGYNGYEQLNTVSHTIRFQYLKEHRLNVHIDDITESQNNVEEQQQLKVSATLMCEYMVVLSQFVYFGYEYYKSVCGSNVNETSSLEKTCLVPICAFQSFLKKSTFDNNNNNTNNNDDPIIKSEIIDSDVNSNNNNSSRKRQLSGSHSPDNDDRQKKTKLDIPDRGQGLSAECMKGVDYALQVLSKAADCLRHLVDMCQWASINSLVDDQSKLLQSWEGELNRIIAYYNLPFDIKNAVLLVQSDLALSLPSVPGNLAKALELSQTICDRIEAERRNENKSEELDIPFMFAFRVLYSIAVIYLLVGSVQQSTLEIAIILSVFPIPIEMDETSFIADEIDCGIVSKVFQDHEFGLMQVNQVGLVVRCIKHLVVGLDNESEQRTGLASIDSAMRWDEKAGNMIVLMQYGWPYWNLRTNMWEKIINRIKEKRVFKNREFLEYIYVEDVLKTIQSIHDSGSTTMDIIPPEFALRGSYRHLITPQPTRLSTYPKDTNTVSSSTSTTTVAESSLSTTNNNNNNSDKKSSTDDDLIDPTEDDNDDKNLPSRSAPPPIYQPSFSNQILPSMTMSPSWYAASTQKNEYASWMSPSFYYSRPATSVLLAKKQKELSDKYSEPNENHHYSHPHRHHHHNNNKNDDNPKLKSIQDSDEPITPFIPRDIVSRCLDYRLQRYSPKVTPQRMRHVLQKFLKNMVLKGNDEV